MHKIGNINSLNKQSGIGKTKNKYLYTDIIIKKNSPSNMNS